MRKTQNIVILFIACLFIFSVIVNADLDSYHRSLADIRDIVDGLKEAREEIKNDKLPVLEDEVDKQIEDLKKGIEEHQEHIDYYKEKFKDDQENFLGYTKGYRKNLELNKKLINLLQGYRDQGMSQITSQGKAVADELKKKYQIDNFIGGPSLEVLAGIYWSKFRLDKISDLISLANSNMYKGISEERWNFLNKDYDQRYAQEASDPGDYWGTRPTVGGEKDLYAALYRLGQEFNKLSSEEKRKVKTPLDKRGDKLIEETPVNFWTNGTTSIESCRGVLIRRGPHWGSMAGKTVHARTSSFLAPGDQIIVMKNGYARLKVGEGQDYGIVDVWPNSIANIGEEKKRIKVKGGFLHYMKEGIKDKLNPVLNPDGYECETPSAVIGTRGTEYITYVDDEGNSVFFLKEGEIVVKSKTTEQETVMKPGQSLVVLADGRIAPPEDMTGKDREMFEFDPKELLTAEAVDPAYLENGLYYTWYEASSYAEQNGHPENMEEMDQYFGEVNEGIVYGGYGIYRNDINWTEYENRPEYLPDDYFSLILDGYIYIPVEGKYSFALDSDDASDLMIDEEPVLGWYGVHGIANNYEHKGEVELSAGYHLIQVRMEDGSGGEALKLYWKKADYTDFSIIPASNFYIDKEPAGIDDGYTVDNPDTSGRSDSTGNGSTGDNNVTISDNNGSDDAGDTNDAGTTIDSSHGEDSSKINPENLQNGLYYTWFETRDYAAENDHPGDIDGMNQYFSDSNPGIVYKGDGLYIGKVNWTEYENKPEYLPADYFSLMLEGYIYIPEDGKYTFALDSDDSSDLTIDYEPIIDWYGIHGTANNYDHNVEIYLSSGYHRIVVRMEDGYGGEALKLYWKKPSDIDFTLIPAENFYVER